MSKRIYYIVLIAILSGLLLVTGCIEGSAMPVDGNTVKIHYTGTLDDGTVFDSSLERDPLEFTVGAGEVIVGFENAVKTLHVGETGTFTIPPEEAYGPIQEPAELTIDKDRLPEDMEPVVGMQLQMQMSSGLAAVAVVTEVLEDTITVSVDTNHPLAGQSLTFEIELLEIL